MGQNCIFQDKAHKTGTPRRYRMQQGNDGLGVTRSTIIYQWLLVYKVDLLHGGSGGILFIKY